MRAVSSLRADNRQDAKSAEVAKMERVPAKSSPLEPSAELDELAHQVIGAAIEVHRHLGPGLLESVYEQAFCVELNLLGINFRRQASVELSYKGHHVGQGRLDLLVENKLVVELKAVEKLTDVHKAQVLSYLRTTGYHLGLLINFNVRVLRAGIMRLVHTA